MFGGRELCTLAQSFDDQLILTTIIHIVFINDRLMKKIILIALMTALGFSLMQAQQSSPTQANSDDPIPEGMARRRLVDLHCRDWWLGD